MTSNPAESIEKQLANMRLGSGEPNLPDELAYIISSFIPTQSQDVKSKAFLILSAYCQGVRASFSVAGKRPDPATERLIKIFSPFIVPPLAETDETKIMQGVTLLTALFQVDGESAACIFRLEAVLEAIMDTVDLWPSSELTLEVAHLLSQACGNKSCRSIIPSSTIDWLELQKNQANSASVKAAAGVAIVKHSQGSSQDTTGTSGQNDTTHRNELEVSLAREMKGIVVSETEIPSFADAVEALAYLTINPNVKEMLSLDLDFLRKLFSLAPRRKFHASKLSGYSSTLYFGVLTIVSNVCAYRPRLTQEQAQMDRLKRMANAKSSEDETSFTSSLDDDRNVKERIRRLVASGVLDIFPAAASESSSAGIRACAGKALLSITEDKENRGKILQSGGGRVLISIVKQSLSSSSSSSTVDQSTLETIQALAKLAITSSPIQVFGPDVGAIYDAVRPFSIMVQHSTSTLLQRFEGVMALTNLASQSPEVASRTAAAEGLLNNVELLLLEDHTLVRRASMELICNLIAGADTVYHRYGGPGSSKLQLLVALSDVDDLPTRLAASGALATVTSSPEACAALLSLQRERRRVLPILTQLIQPSDEVGNSSDSTAHLGLVHRGVICVINFFENLGEDGRKEIREEGEKIRLLKALQNIVEKQSLSDGIRQPAAKALDILR